MPRVTPAVASVPNCPIRIDPKEPISPNTVPNRPNRGERAITASSSLSPLRMALSSSSAADSRARRKSSGSGSSSFRGAAKNRPIGWSRALLAIGPALLQSLRADSRIRSATSRSRSKMRPQNQQRSKTVPTDSTDSVNNGHMAGPPLVNRSLTLTVSSLLVARSLVPWPERRRAKASVSPAPRAQHCARLYT